MSHNNSINQQLWMQTLTTEVTDLTHQSVVQWCNVVSKLGLDPSLQVKWTSIFKRQIKEVCNDMIEEAVENQNKLLDKIESLLKKLEEICKNLHIKMPQHGSNELTLTDEYLSLESRLEEYEKIFANKKKEITRLLDLQDSLCQALGWKPKEISISPLPSSQKINELKQFIETMENEKFERSENFLQMKSKIIELVAIVKYIPNLDIERDVLSQDDSQFSVTDTNMLKLNEFYESLKCLQAQTEEQVCEAREKVRNLWEILNVDIHYSQEFLSNNVGSSLIVLEALKAEIERCELLKKANIRKFVEKLRTDLKSLWDQCHFTPEEREHFIYIESDLYTEDLLTLHDLEVDKMKKFFETNSELYILLEKRKNLWNKMLTLDENMASKDRYKNRGGQLLQEEKERNTLSKKIPNIEEQLNRFAQEFERKYGKPFTSWGESIEQIISHDHEARNETKRLKLSAHKQTRDKTPCKSILGATPSKTLLSVGQLTPSSAKRKLAFTPSSCSSKRSRFPDENCNSALRIAYNKGPRFSTERAKRDARKRRISQKGSSKKTKVNKESSSTSSDYAAFEKDIEGKKNCRSTLFKSENKSIEEGTPLPRTPKIIVTSAPPLSRTRSPIVKSKFTTAPLKLLI